MFERFRRSRGTEPAAGSVATRERTGSVSELGDANPRVDEGRFVRESPGERDRAVTAGGGEADLAADRPFERDTMARGGMAAGDTTLGRDTARDDLARDEMGPRDEVAARDDVAARDEMAAREDAAAGEHRHHPGAGAVAAGAAGAAAGAAIEHHRERKRDEAVREEVARDEAARDRAAARAPGRGLEPGPDPGPEGDPTIVRDPALEPDRMAARERHAPVLGPAALDTMRARQRDRFGGIQWGSDFFGWLCAIGLASILIAALVAGGVALGLSTNDASNANTAQQIGLGGGIALLVALAIAWFCGGYVAGRMARFDGARQGIGVWLWTILAAIIVAAVAAIGGTGYDIYERLNLPRIAVGGSTLTAGGAIAGAAAIVVTLLFAVIGGKVGERYHRRVDRVATDEYVVE